MPDAFRVEDLDGGIALVTFDLPDKKVNTLGQSVLRELAGLVGSLAQRTDLKGLLFRSGKPGQFIAGADLNDLAMLAFATPEQAAGALGAGHQIFNGLSQLPYPTVALIDGNCMGGGTELVLSMDDRIASAEPHTQIALPEVKVGLIPGWGGTQRLPRLIGLNPAIEMITSGEPVAAQKAAAIGLVFDAVPADRLVEEGKRRIEYLRQSGEWKERREAAAPAARAGPGRDDVRLRRRRGLRQVEDQGAVSRALVALKAIREGCNLPLDQGLKAEQKAVGEIVGSPILGNLIAIFFMKNRLSRDPGVTDASAKPREIRSAGVLGTGLMGAGIAAAHARSGIRTAMVDVDDARIKDGLQRASDVVMSRIKIGRATPQDMANMLAMLNTSTSLSLFADSRHRHRGDHRERGGQEGGLPEPRQGDAGRRDPRQQHLDDLDHAPGRVVAAPRAVRRDALLQPGRPHGAGRGDPRGEDERRDGCHRGRAGEADPQDADRGQGLRGVPGQPRPVSLHERVAGAARAGRADGGDRQGGREVRHADGPDHAHGPRRAGDGRVCRQGGDRGVSRPRGQLANPRGDAPGRRRREVGAPVLQRQGQGRQARAEPGGHGDHRQASDASTTAMDEAEITDRLFLPMLLEATRVLEEGIVREPGDVDMGLILGIGFPPFRGGILRWADTVGAAAIVERLAKYAPLGKRYEPTESLLKLAKEGGTFYPRPKLGTAS